jgi:hypothetical protein
MKLRLLMVTGALLVSAQSMAEPAASGGDRSPRPAAAPRVLDRLDLDASRITGTRELPKVMAIVPWKGDEAGPGVELGYSTLVDQALRGVDREVFKTETQYFEILAAGKHAPATSTAR